MSTITVSPTMIHSQVIPQNKLINTIGFWAALVAFAASVGFDVAQILQVVGFVTYPLDAILIYGFSLGIPIPFILAMLALHYSVPNDKKIWTHAALLFTVMYALYVTLNYVVQLATVIPASLQGTLDEIRVLDQTPHSLFWDVDALGYIFMGIATLFAVPVFAKQGLERWVRCFSWLIFSSPPWLHWCTSIRRSPRRYSFSLHHG